MVSEYRDSYSLVYHHSAAERDGAPGSRRPQGGVNSARNVRNFGPLLTAKRESGNNVRHGA